MATGNGKAGSKIILSGEHFVVHGSPALAAPIPHFTLRATVSDEGPNSPRDSLIDYALKICRLHWGGPGEELRATISSQIPQAAGMGSSAALSVAIVRAYADYSQISLTQKETFDLSMKIEKRAHGNPSGIDSTVITYEEPLYFTRGGERDFLETPGKTGIALLNSNEPSQTRAMVEKVHQFQREKPTQFESILNRAKTLVREFKTNLEEGKAREVARLASENHELLRQVGVEAPATDYLYREAMAAGAWGAKMSGGGGGGILLAFTEKEKLDSLTQSLAHRELSLLTTLAL